jgi:hypothetical protein
MKNIILNSQPPLFQKLSIGDGIILDISGGQDYDIERNEKYFNLNIIVAKIVKQEDHPDKNEKIFVLNDSNQHLRAFVAFSLTEVLSVSNFINGLRSLEKKIEKYLDDKNCFKV